MPEYFPPVQQNAGLAEAIANLIQQRGATIGGTLSNIGQNLGQAIQSAQNKKQQQITPDQITGLRQAVNAPAPIGNEERSFAGGVGGNQPLNIAQKDYLTRLLDQKQTEDRMMALQNLKGTQQQEAISSKATQAKTLEDLKAQHKKELEEWQAKHPKPASPSVGLRDEQFWERQKVAAGKDMDISRATSRSPLGVAVTNNQKARRALKLLNSKDTFTPQDQSLITTDLTAMMKGGSPDEELLRQQQYPGLYTSGISLLQKITNKPQNLNDPEIKQHLKDIITGIVNVDDNQIKDHIDSAENQYADLIAKDPKWWEKTKKTASRNLFTESQSSGKYDDVINKVMGGTNAGSQ